MLSSIMMNPFLTQHSQCLSDVAAAFQSTMVNCWPRVLDQYSAEILRSTVVCWLNLCDAHVKGYAADEKRLREALRNLATLVSTSRDGSHGSYLAGLSRTIEDKPELLALFGQSCQP